MKKILNCKPLYVVLLILSALVLSATLFIRVAVSDTMAGAVTVPNGGSFDLSSLPTDGSFDTSSLPNGGSFDVSSMPNGGSFDASSMPNGGSFDMSSIPNGGSVDKSSASSESREGSSGFSGFPGMSSGFSQSSGGFGLLQSIRKAWLPICLVSLAIMVFSLVRLVRIGKHRKQEREAQEAARMEGLTQKEILELRAKEEAEQLAFLRSQKKTKNIILLGVLVVVIAFVTVVGKMLSSDSVVSNNSEVNEEVLSAAVEKGNVEAVVKGTGTVSSTDVTEVGLPGDVKIAAWLVSNGDLVSEGDAIAEVDTDSLAAAITDLQALIAELDEDLEAARKDTVSDAITAIADGRVVKIYTEEDESVAERVAESGALMSVSLDGTLAVNLELNNDISVGTELQVTTSDGSVLTGKLTAKNQTEMVVTVSDENTLVGDTVSVADADGKNLGSGTLYIHSEQKVTGFVGTVDSIKVEEGELVEAGDVLITLDDVDYSIVYSQLLEKRTAFENQMRALIAAYASGYLYAEADGVISDIEDETASSSSVSSVSSSNESTGQTDATVKQSREVRTGTSVAYISNLSATGNSSVHVVSLAATNSDSGTVTDSRPEAANPPAGVTGENAETALGAATNGTEDPAANENREPEAAAPTVSDAPNSGEKENTDGTEAPAEGATSAAGGEEIPSDNDGETPTPGDRPNQGEMPGTGEETDGDQTEALRSLLLEKINTLDYETLMKIFELLQEAESGGSSTGGLPSQGDSSGSGQSGFGGGGFGGGGFSGGGFSSGGLSSGFNAGSGTTSGTTSSNSEEENEIDVSRYELTETTFCRITRESEKSVDIQVDEQNIGLVSIGGKVTVSLDAYSGKSFPGTITAVDKEGSNSGGSTKYTVTVQITPEDTVLDGMNASVILSKETRTDVLTIPLNAVYEEGTKVYVYTTYDEKSDELGTPVEVELGLSDGENAEVLSGLNDGDTYYYRYAGSITYNFLSRLAKG